MTKILIIIIALNISVILEGQIIADHKIVDMFDKIPQEYIDKIKKMWVVVPGESHSGAYRTGLTLLESLFPSYNVSVIEYGTPEAYTTSNLRFSRGTWGDYSHTTGWIYHYGEEDWFTNATAISRTKAGITYCNTHNLEIAAIGFGWCWDMVYGDASPSVDQVYGCRWYGETVNGPDGDRYWGIEASDFTITSNSVSMETYLSTTQDYIEYCKENNYATKVFFTTGPVDTYYSSGEAGYQGSVKHQFIRDYVKKDPSRILFDYADILCYDDNGAQNLVIWNGHTFPRITAANGTPEQTGHISNIGAVRIAKAMWWMLARIAGWNGSFSSEVTDTNYNTGILKKVVTRNKIEILLDEKFISGKAVLYDFQGVRLSEKNIENNILTFEKSAYPPGIYFLVFNNGNNRSVEKVIFH